MAAMGKIQGWWKRSCMIGQDQKVMFHGWIHWWTVPNWVLLPDTKSMQNGSMLSSCIMNSVSEGCAVIAIDFADLNIKIRPTAYYCYSQVTLHPVVIFSEGCSAQYKSKRPFHYLQNMATDILHLYFGSRHGNNLCDALGGTVKSVAKREVKARNATVRNVDHLYSFCQRRLQVSSGACWHKKRCFFSCEGRGCDSNCTIIRT